MFSIFFQVGIQHSWPHMTISKIEVRQYYLQDWCYESKPYWPKPKQHICPKIKQDLIPFKIKNHIIVCTIIYLNSDFISSSVGGKRSWSKEFLWNKALLQFFEIDKS